MRFAIRDLFWLTFVVALTVCWWMDRQRAFRQQWDDKAGLAAQQHALAAAELQLTMVQAKLETARAEEKALKDQLAGFIAAQEDKLTIDVGPSLFRRLTNG